MGELISLKNGRLVAVIFGGTGDLARRKLAPALYNLAISGRLPADFTLVGIGRRETTDGAYREELKAAVKKYSPDTFTDPKWKALADHITYFRADLTDGDSYRRLKERIDHGGDRKKVMDNRLYYLAVSPHLFNPIVENLGRHGLAAPERGWRRIMIEKPFGFDLASAATLNRVIAGVFSEDNIYRIDHYLGKEMLQNITVIRFANTVFEPLWNNRFIDHVQISALESDGIGDRGRYYDQAGAMRDMIQSHLLQMLAVTAMERPAGWEPGTVRAEKLKLLKALQPRPAEAGEGEALVFGQYKGFLAEKDISSRSRTETFAALRLCIDNPRWRGVPFFLRTGKKLGEKQVKIVFRFKKPPVHLLPGALFSAPEAGGASEEALFNLLTIKVQPSEGVVFQFNIRKPASTEEIVPVDMDFCRPCAFLINSPEAYERLIEDAVRGDQSRFTSWEEINTTWALTDSLYARFVESGRAVELYEAGSWGPRSAETMLTDLGRRWFNP